MEMSSLRTDSLVGGLLGTGSDGDIAMGCSMKGCGTQARSMSVVITALLSALRAAPEPGTLKTSAGGSPMTVTPASGRAAVRSNRYDESIRGSRGMLGSLACTSTTAGALMEADVDPLALTGAISPDKPASPDATASPGAACSLLRLETPANLFCSAVRRPFSISSSLSVSSRR